MNDQRKPAEQIFRACPVDCHVRPIVTGAKRCPKNKCATW